MVAARQLARVLVERLLKGRNTEINSLLYWINPRSLQSEKCFTIITRNSLELDRKRRIGKRISTNQITESRG